MMKNKENTNKNAINFVLFSLLGVTLDSEEDELLEAAIQRAYQDASRHVLSFCNDYNKQKIEEFKKDAGEKIKKEILSLNEKENKENAYKCWHIRLRKTLVDTYRDKTTKDKPFTYGIAQKWINMTMKYLFVMREIYEDYGVSWPSTLAFLDKFKKDLHVPIDRYIIDAVWNEEVFLPLKEDKKGKVADRNKKYKYPNEYVEAWSKWGEDKNAEDIEKDIEKWKMEHVKNENKENKEEEDPSPYYGEFQKTIKEIKQVQCSPLDWENENWINIAKKYRKLKKA